MKNLVTIIVLMASLCFSQDKVWGTFSDLKWTGEGKDKVASWAGPIANNWWDGLGLSSVWPVDEGSGTTIYDKIGGKNATAEGADIKWITLDGLTCIDCGKDTPNTYGVSRISIVDRSVYNLESSNLLFGAWYRAKWIPSSINTYLLGKGASSLTMGNYGLRGVPPSFAAYVKSGATSVTTPTTLVPEAEWTHLATCVDRSSKTVSLFTNGVLATYATYPTDNGYVTNANPFCLFYNAATLSESKINGSIRDFFVKVGGTTNDIPAIYNATKTTYGK